MKYALGRAKAGYKQEKEKLLHELKDLELDRDIVIIEEVASGKDNKKHKNMDEKIAKIIKRLHKICTSK
jgi:hypothetical protein